MSVLNYCLFGQNVKKWDKLTKLSGWHYTACTIHLIYVAYRRILTLKKSILDLCKTTSLQSFKRKLLPIFQLFHIFNSWLVQSSWNSIVALNVFGAFLPILVFCSHPYPHLFTVNLTSCYLPISLSPVSHSLFLWQDVFPSNPQG